MDSTVRGESANALANQTPAGSQLPQPGHGGAGTAVQINVLGPQGVDQVDDYTGRVFHRLVHTTGSPQHATASGSSDEAAKVNDTVLPAHPLEWNGQVHPVISLVDDRFPHKGPCAGVLDEYPESHRGRVGVLPVLHR